MLASWRASMKFVQSEGPSLVQTGYTGSHVETTRIIGRMPRSSKFSMHTSRDVLNGLHYKGSRGRFNFGRNKKRDEKLKFKTAEFLRIFLDPHTGK